MITNNNNKLILNYNIPENTNIIINTTKTIYNKYCIYIYICIYCLPYYNNTIIMNTIPDRRRLLRVHVHLLRLASRGNNDNNNNNNNNNDNDNLFSRISQTTVSTRWPKPKCTIPAWPSQRKIVGC